MYYLVDFLLRVREECREVAESVAVEHHLGLFICASHYVPNSPQGSSLGVERVSDIVTIIIRFMYRLLSWIHVSFGT